MCTGFAGFIFYCSLCKNVDYDVKSDWKVDISKPYHLEMGFILLFNFSGKMALQINRWTIIIKVLANYYQGVSQLF